jgi:hypothetical protein
MTVKVRRVVTGHDGKGRALVKIDEIAKNVISNRPGASSCVVWTTEGFPVDNTGDAVTSTRLSASWGVGLIGVLMRGFS